MYRSFFLNVVFQTVHVTAHILAPCPIDSSGDIGRAPVLTDAFLVLLTVHVAWKGQFCLGEVEENAS